MISLNKILAWLNKILAWPCQTGYIIIHAAVKLLLP